MIKKRKELILSILGILGLVVITIGVSYSFFNYAKEGTTDNVITTGSITFLYTEVSGVGNGISIENAYPISDEVGKVKTGEGEYFDFKITSDTFGEASIPYEVTARKKADSTLDEEAVRMYLVDQDTNEELLLENYSNLNQTSKVEASKHIEKTIYTGKVPADTKDYEKNFRLRMWIDENVDFSQNEDGTYPYNGKTFTIIVNVYANAKVITEEDSKAEITNISVDGMELTAVEGEAYDYETNLPSGTASTTINVETVSENATVTIERLDSLAYNSSVKRLAVKKTLDLIEGDNYFKITVTSEDEVVENQYILNIRVGDYKEVVLNGADPVLTNNLIPVEIDDSGKVTKADLTKEWYDYETKRWANAVVLRSTDTYEIGDAIDEDDIESYFVWIPKYSYQLWDLGNYSSLTSISSKEQTINIRFGLTNTSDSIAGECTTPKTAGSSGNCSAGTTGDYMTHPAFLAFDTNGFWVGKFETGFDGATSSTTTEMNTYNKDKIIIKPNVYSWRNNTIGNMFKASLDYISSDNSHMMKNTEWGAVAYLQHSQYGSATSVRVNNNSSFITGYAATEEPTKGYRDTSVDGNRYESTSIGVDGTYTVNYLNSNSVVASTTGNYTGIYDMSGGANEYVMGYTTTSSIGIGGSSGITSLYSDFFTNSEYNKYYDKYSSTKETDYNNRILGDATGEMGPFGNYVDSVLGNRPKTSWYGDYTVFVNSSRPWFSRGFAWTNGSETGVFSLYNLYGGIHSATSFRVVLAPAK